MTAQWHVYGLTHITGPDGRDVEIQLRHRAVVDGHEVQAVVWCAVKGRLFQVLARIPLTRAGDELAAEQSADLAKVTVEAHTKQMIALGNWKRGATYAVGV